ncbi:hypothetical protein [Salibaculum griseiflavum]|uniref:hypothetical protein n=1 Tax=Salibaculum griseiflavum TaxID=1914409 RepID=UPI001C37F11B|nr:hypothetical protein [Salibaculum griseiflavum]
MTELERELEQALLEYVERYGLTPKARAVLGRSPSERVEPGAQPTDVTPSDEAVSK